MQMLIENIGGIKKAEIDLSGLCVIASEDAQPLYVLPELVSAIVHAFFTGSVWDAPRTFRDAMATVFGSSIPLPSEQGRICLSSQGKTLLGVSVAGDGAVELYAYTAPGSALRATYGYLTAFYGGGDWHYPTRDLWFRIDLSRQEIHPKKQVLLAKAVVEGVKTAEFGLIVSHSPYMVEALKRYSDREGLPAKFGLVGEDGILRYDCLSTIFAGFAEPFEEFSRMDAEELNKSLNEDEAERNNKEGQKQ